MKKIDVGDVPGVRHCCSGYVSLKFPADYRFSASRHVRGQDIEGCQAGRLPVEQPAMFELVINLKTAKALGLDVPPIMQALADKVIE